MDKVLITIDRSKWRTGGISIHKTGDGPTRLKNEQGYMCCWGFICEGLGYDIEFQTNYEPYDLKQEIPGVTIPNPNNIEDIPFINRDIVDETISLNDDLCTTPQKKEEQLEKIFNDPNNNFPFRVQFVGEFELG